MFQLTGLPIHAIGIGFSNKVKTLKATKAGGLNNNYYISGSVSNYIKNLNRITQYGQCA